MNPRQLVPTPSSAHLLTKKLSSEVQFQPGTISQAALAFSSEADHGPREDGLSLAVDAAWRLHFHAPADALEAATTWSDAALGLSPENRLFVQIVITASQIRTEPLDLCETLIKDLENELAALPEQPARSRLKGLVDALVAVLAWRKREFDTALVRFNQALQERLDDGDGYFILHWRALALLGSGKPQFAFRDCLAAREYFRTRDKASYALLSFNVGVMLTHAGDWDAAEASLRAALADARLVRVPSFDAMARSNYAYCLVNTGKLYEAGEQIGLILDSDREGFLRLKPGDVLTTIAENLIATGHLELGGDYAQRSLADARQRDFGLGIGTAQWNLGQLAALTGDAGNAARCFAEALLILRHHPQQTQFWKTARAVSELYAKLGDFRRAFHWHRRFHVVYRRWQNATSDVRLSYAQALLEIESVRAERDAAEAESARLAKAMQDLEVLNVELRKRIDQVEKLQAELREQAIRDPLTGLLNRRGLTSTLQRLVEDGERLGVSGCVAMLDLDRFKRVNDEFGHAVGDRVLAEAGRIMLEVFRRTDVAFRYGGDEFCVLMPGADMAVAEQRMHDFSARLTESMKTVTPELPFDISVSFGLAPYPQPGKKPRHLLDAADQALYRDKRAEPR
jgi:diguanylate cyclase (GGDEF)-like protein